MSGLRLYWRYVSVYGEGLMQYRASFIARMVSTFGIGITEWIGIIILFSRFKALGGWTMTETLLLFSIASMAFGFAEWLGRGFDKFPASVASGDFDRVLLRPRSTVLQVLGTRFELSKVSRIIQGALLCAWCLGSLDVSLTPAKLGLLVAAVISGAFVYTGVFVIFATLSFWTVESVELAYVLTNNTLDMFQYPIEVYNGFFRRFFTFVVPLACITYYPLLAILGKADATRLPTWFPWCAPALGPLFFAAALGFWHFGVRHYHSTGS